MAILKHGISGPVEGSIGTLNYYVVNGKNIVRSRRKKSTIPASTKQLAVRQRMKIASGFLKQLVEFVTIGFANAVREGSGSAYNIATAEVLSHAIKGAYPDYELDYTKVVLSSGTLLPAIHPAVDCIEGRLVFNWQPEEEWPDSNDRVMMVAYCPELNEAVYNLVGARRSAGTDVLDLDISWSGKAVETYISFRSERKEVLAASLYTGRITCL